MLNQSHLDAIDSIITMTKLMNNDSIFITNYKTKNQNCIVLNKRFGYSYYQFLGFYYNEDKVDVKMLCNIIRDKKWIKIFSNLKIKSRRYYNDSFNYRKEYLIKFRDKEEFQNFFDEVIMKNIGYLFQEENSYVPLK